MARKHLPLRLDESYIAWIDEYAKQRGWTRTQVVQTAVHHFHGLVEGGVPDLEEASGPARPRQARGGPSSQPPQPAPPRDSGEISDSVREFMSKMGRPLER
jgi:hypothetical protein